MSAEDLRSRFGAAEMWTLAVDGWWLEDARLDVEAMAGHMVEAGARLVTLTVRPVTVGEHSIAYHWDLEGDMLTLVTLTHEGSVASIAGLCPAADWIERETHDYFGVDFIGRRDLPSLVLRPGDRPGLFHWNGHPGESL